MRLRYSVLFLALALAVVGCDESPEAPTPLVTREQPLAAYCTANVTGTGVVDVEVNDACRSRGDCYLANVVYCENGSADFQALKAQAVAARSYLYYRNGSIGDGQTDQVYSCAGAPRDEHYRAVEETAGEVLTYNGVKVAAFYVAGAKPSTADCVPTTADITNTDWSNTEHFVTYNWGLSGADLEQTTLGWVSAGNYANRGCKSQNGANCLSLAGWDYRDILKFYYGMDIVHERAEGSCVTPVQCSPVIDADEAIIDDRDSCFSHQCRMGSAWWSENAGYQGLLWATYAWDQPTDCTGTWELVFASGGRFDVEVYLSDIGAPLTTQAPYTVRHAGSQTVLTVNQSSERGWVWLGQFDFAAGGDQWVALEDNTGEPYVDQNGKRLLFDAVRVRRAGVPPADVASDTGSDTVVDAAPDLGPPDLISDPAPDASGETTMDTTGTDSQMIPDSSTSAEVAEGSSEVSPRGDVTGDCACELRPRASRGFSALFGFAFAVFVLRLRRRRGRVCFGER